MQQQALNMQAQVQAQTAMMQQQQMAQQ